MKGHVQSEAEIDDVSSNTGRLLGPFLVGISFTLFHTAVWLGILLAARPIAERFLQGEKA